MKKIMILILVLFLSGCAPYKFQKGQPPYDKGYVASREGYTIVDYTIGRDNTVAQNVALAKERFKRRRRVVEDYYKKMGAIENRFKQAVIDYPVMFFKLALGVFKMPGIAIKDYRYNHNPKYRERIDKLEEEKEIQEQARIKKLKDALNNYIQKDLEKEPPVIQAKEEVSSKMPVEKAQEVALIEKPKEIENNAVVITETKDAQVLQEEIKKQEIEEKTIPQEKIPLEKIEPKKEKLEEKIPGVTKKQERPSQIKAVIVARPQKGFSPLTVHFFGNKSHSSAGRIVAYAWDFGDGDTSSKENPINKYYSVSFEPKEFTVTLTVQDSKGNKATSSVVIEVLNK